MAKNAALLKDLSIRVDGLRRAMDAVIGGTTPDHGKWGAFKSYARAYNGFVQKYAEITRDSSLSSYNLDNIRGSGDTVWPVQKEIFDMVYADVLILGSLLSAYAFEDDISKSEIQDLITANLRKVIFSKPERELDVQNAIETLLVGRGYQKGITYDREAGKVKFSGKEFIPDFVFPNVQTAMEVKLIREKSGISKCVEEMSADIAAYLSVYKTIIFCVYDLGEIRDVNEFQAGFQSQSGVRICTVKH
ncbi:hypothetical protein [Roseomonas sp. BN140053]|uniref:PD-(D/E)XK nuclease domain-containing protein n=1 Tax=Roseomonas sp. BN140053 TaxID=3391898 RepID=UPI0039ED241E